MARGRKRTPQVAAHVIIDATPERIAMAMAVNDDGEILDDGYTWTNAAEIDPREQAINRVRRFQDTPLDKIYRAKVINHSQYAAGDWYRNIYAKMCMEPKVVASYGERTTGGEGVSFLPKTERQRKARAAFHRARAQWPKDMIGTMDKLLLRNRLADQRGYARMKTFRQIRAALDEMAFYLRLPIDPTERNT